MKIAFTGSHGVGKTTVVNILKELLKDEKIVTLESTTRKVLSWDVIDDSSPTFQLICIFLRRGWMLENKDADFVISERWALDELAYQYYQCQGTADIKVWDAYGVCKNEVEWELDNYWDTIYYIPVTDREVEDDGIRPTDKQYQRDIDAEISKRIDFLIGRGYNIKVVPQVLDEIKEFFQEEIKKWNK